MTVMTQPVYSTPATGACGHVAEFGLQPRTLRDPRTVLTLPAEYTLTGKLGELRVETRFCQLQDGTIVAQQGTANKQLLDAVKVIASKSILPYDDRVGIRAVFAGDRVIIVSYLKTDANVKDMCYEIANVVFDDVTNVILRPTRICSMSIRERKEWLEFQEAEQS